MERTDSHRDQSEHTPNDRPRRHEVEIIFTFGPPGTAAAQDACRAVAARDGVDADEAWIHVATEVFDAMNEAGPDGGSEFDRVVSECLCTPVFVFGAVPNRGYQNGSVCPTLHLDATRIVDHYGNPVPGELFGEKVVKGMMASIVHTLESEWARAALITHPVSSPGTAEDDAGHAPIAECDDVRRVSTVAELAEFLRNAAREHGWGVDAEAHREGGEADPCDGQ
jgi:hypothetical protein